MTDPDLASRLVHAVLDRLDEDECLAGDVSIEQFEACRAAVQYELDISGMVRHD